MAADEVRRQVAAAMTDYFTLLSQMPHYRPDALCMPPPEGWELDFAALRARGRSDAAIELARHLPYLDPCIGCERAWITPSSPAFAIHRGEIWPEWVKIGIGVETPPHLFHLTSTIDARSGVYLCVDTERGTIVEIAGKLKDGISWDDYDQLSDAEKWTAYRASPASEFFAIEAKRLLNLLYMPTPPAPSANAGADPHFYHRAQNLLDEEQLLSVEDEWEADHEQDSDYAEDSRSLGDSDQNTSDIAAPDSDDEDMLSDDDELYTDEDALEDGELDGLRKDTEEYVQSHDPSGQQLGTWKPIVLPEATLRVYDIYKRNGWPYHHFDADACRAQLLELAEEQYQVQFGTKSRFHLSDRAQREFDKRIAAYNRGEGDLKGF